MERPDSAALPTGPELSERLREPLAGLGLALDPDQAELLSRYLGLLLPWNARVNLTGARSAAEVVDRHLADGFALAARLGSGALRFLDVGAGAGFLGVAVAVLRPDATCVLLEPVGKKHTFLRAVARELPLPNLQPLAERLEVHLARADFAPYDVAASCATWSPGEWLERARPAVRPGGLAVAFEGGEPGTLPPGAARFPYRFAARRAALLIREG